MAPGLAVEKIVVFSILNRENNLKHGISQENESFFGLLLNKTLQNSANKGSIDRRNSIFMRGWQIRSQTASQVCQFRRNLLAIVFRNPRKIRAAKFHRSLRRRVFRSRRSRSLKFRQSFASRNRRTDQSRQSCVWGAVHWIQSPDCSSRKARLGGRRRSAAFSSALDERFKGK